MSEGNDGGPAFPDRHYRGMSQRDWFAGQAIRVVVAELVRGGIHPEAEIVAVGCYALADAMLEARKK